MRLLVVEDVRPLAKTIVQGLTEEGFAVDLATDGLDALHMARELDYDVIVLDRMLPELDGLQVLERLRAEGKTTKVLLLTALGEVHDRVAGLDAGADDYLVKPFAFAELVARVRALARREYGRVSNALHVGPLALDLAARQATVRGQALELTAREYGLLELLVLQPGATLSRTAITQALYADDEDKDSNVIDVFVARLRRKLTGAGLRGGEVIRTLRGEGYRLDPAALEDGK